MTRDNVPPNSLAEIGLREAIREYLEGEVAAGRVRYESETDRYVGVVGESA